MTTRTTNAELRIALDNYAAVLGQFPHYVSSELDVRPCGGSRLRVVRIDKAIASNPCLRNDVPGFISTGWGDGFTKSGLCAALWHAARVAQDLRPDTAPAK